MAGFVKIRGTRWKRNATNSESMLHTLFQELKGLGFSNPQMEVGKVCLSHKYVTLIIKTQLPEVIITEVWR